MELVAQLGQVTVGGRSPDPESFCELMHRFTGRGESATVVLSVLVTSHASRSSKSRVWPDPGERHPLGPHAVLRAGQSPAQQHDPANPATHVQVPPRRVDSTRVVAVPCREPASRTRQPPPAQPDPHPQLAVDDGNLADPHTRQLQDSVEEG